MWSSRLGPFGRDVEPEADGLVGIVYCQHADGVYVPNAGRKRRNVSQVDLEE